jgi:hypothetical protein
MRATISLVGVLGLTLITQGCATYTVDKVISTWGENKESLRARGELPDPAGGLTLSVDLFFQEQSPRDLELFTVHDAGGWSSRLRRVEGESADRIAENARASGALGPSDEPTMALEAPNVPPEAPNAPPCSQVLLVEAGDKHFFLAESDGWHRLRTVTFEQTHSHVLKTIGAALLFGPALLIDIATFPISVPLGIMLFALDGRPWRY